MSDDGHSRDVATVDLNMIRATGLTLAEAQDKIWSRETPEGPWWYMSFCDPTLPKGSQFVGACYVQSEYDLWAPMEAWKQGCNPGGEIAIWGPFPDDEQFREDVPLGDRNRVLNRRELGYADDHDEGKDVTDDEF